MSIMSTRMGNTKYNKPEQLQHQQSGPIPWNASHYEKDLDHTLTAHCVDNVDLGDDKAGPVEVPDQYVPDPISLSEDNHC